MVEIRAADLRFRLDEATILLNHILQLGFCADEIARLDRKTDGWIAGLVMAAISIQGRENIFDFINSFEGSHRFIFDYLVDEVLNQLSSELQEFLLKMCILDRLCAPLCNAVLICDDSQSFLQQVEKMNLYLFPLDEKHDGFRYHRLFSDLLISRLTEIYPEKVNDLHRRARTCYESKHYGY